MSADGIFDIEFPVTLAHPHVDKAERVPAKKGGQPMGEPKFSADLVVDPSHPQFDAIKATVIRLATEKFPGRNFLTPTEPNYQPIQWPFHNGTKIADDRKRECEAQNKPADAEYARGKMVIKARSLFRPSLNHLKNGVVELSEADIPTLCPKLFFFGADVVARLEFNAYDTGLAQGVNAYLVGLGGVGEGKAIAGAKRSMSNVAAFQNYKGRVTSENPYQATPAASALPV